MGEGVRGGGARWRRPVKRPATQVRFMMREVGTERGREAGMRMICGVR